MSKYFNLYDLNYNSLGDSKIKQLVDLVKKKHVRRFRTNAKLSFSLSIKRNYSPSAYLDSTRKNPLRRTLVKLRIGCRKLHVETGRYVKIPLDERICSPCGGKFP